MCLDNNCQAFLALVRAGLWEQDVELRKYGDTGFDEILRLAEMQNVVGLVTAGIEHLDVRCQKEDGRGTPSQEDLLQFVGQSLQIEQQNKAMNSFISVLIEEMRKADIYTILVKGQGVAQCYEKPLWRESGDVDFLLSESNYEKTKQFLLPLASYNKHDERYSKHLGMNIDQWYVEIHGTLRTGLSGRVDKEVDDVQKDVFYEGNIRSWTNGNTQVFLPGVNDDVFFVFTHFIKHFYKEGVGLRQICDWCRLLWTYRTEIDVKLLEKRLNRAGLMSEWCGFACLAVDYLEMPIEAMPFYDVINKKDKVRGRQLIKFILGGYSGNKVKDTLAIAKIFPWKTFCYLPSIFLNVNGLKIRERMFGK